MAANSTSRTGPAATSPEAPVDVTHGYRLVRQLHAQGDIWLIERVSDNHQYIGYRWDEPSTSAFSQLLQRGAGAAVAAVLHHPNLVSHIELEQAQFFHGARLGVAQSYVICDYCDAGSLRNLIDKTPVRPQFELRSRKVLQWLPESLVWHVAISLLSALAWLHDGVRQEDAIVWREDGTATRDVIEETPYSRGEDWFPLLHRDIRTDHVFFQHPRGIETYGYCKLGGYGRVFVSGHVHGRALGTSITSDNEEQTEPELKRIVAQAEARAIVAGEVAKGATEEPLNNEIWVEDYSTLAKGHRPYFKGTEAFKVGAILYQMMTRQVLPDPEECEATITIPGLLTPRLDRPDLPDEPLPARQRPCGVRHWEETGDTPCPVWPTGTFRLSDKLEALVQGFDATQPELGYTIELVDLVTRLLGNYRRTVDTSVLLAAAKSAYDDWKATTDEGKRHVDHWDDLVQRETNRRKKDAAEMATAVRQSGPRAEEYVGKAMGGVRTVPVQGR